jgi:hypothetical protein
MIMRQSILKMIFAALALSIGVCQPPSANAQTVGWMKPDGYAATSRSALSPPESGTTTTQFWPGLQPDAYSALATSITGMEKKKRREIQLTVSTREPHTGIAGFVEDVLTGVRISFESRIVGDQLTARIMNKDGYTIIDYVEALTAPPFSDPDSPPQVELVPWLRVNGVEHKGYEGQIVDEMKAVASSKESELIRYLALYIVFSAPGEHLEAERRGLEVPYQAIQKFYERSYKKMGSDNHDRADLEAAGRYGKPLSEGLDSHKTEESPDDFVLMPEGCSMPKCDYVGTHDYQLTEQGGFVVKNVSRRLPLSHNYGRPARANAGSEQIRPTDDGSQVGDCFGRCGGGCGDWTHEWISRTDYDETYCAEINVPPDMPMPDCSWMCCYEERRFVGSQGTAVHTAHGKVTPGAIAHDWCCRNLFLGCWNPVCIALLPGALDCLIPGVGWDETWSYVGPHSEAFDYPTGVCCY